MAEGDKRVRLLKVVCQAVFMVDDGESLSELVGQQVTVAGNDWPDFAENLERDRQAHEEAINHDPA